MNMTFSSVFPATHPRAGNSTDFEAKILDGRKKHTVRQNYNYWAKHNGQSVMLCTWTGRPYKSPIKRFAAATLRVEKIIRVIDRLDNETTEIYMAGQRLASYTLIDFASDDGLTVAEFYNWFDGLQNLMYAACIWLDGVRPYREAIW
jgi:hypothetical protein